MTDIQCKNCGKFIASAQWRWLRTRSYHEGGHCLKTQGVFRLDRYFLDKEHALDYITEMEKFSELNPKWMKSAKRFAIIQNHCPHRETYTLHFDNGDGQEFYTLRCRRCFKTLEEEHQSSSSIS